MVLGARCSRIANRLLVVVIAAAAYPPAHACSHARCRRPPVCLTLWQLHLSAAKNSDSSRPCRALCRAAPLPVHHVSRLPGQAVSASATYILPLPLALFSLSFTDTSHPSSHSTTILSPSNLSTTPTSIPLTRPSTRQTLQSAHSAQSLSPARKPAKLFSWPYGSNDIICCRKIYLGPEGERFCARGRHGS